MKVVVKSKEVNLYIPIPMFMLTSSVKLINFISKKVYENREEGETAERCKKILETIDMDALLKGLRELKGYKGLTLVEVKAKDGTYVLVQM